MKMKAPESGMDTNVLSKNDSSFILREAAALAMAGYSDHLSAGGKGDPAEESWIDALFDGADAIVEMDNLKSRLAQAEQVKDALMYDLKTAIYRGHSFNLDCEFCKDKAKPVCENCSWQWRGPCPENTKEEPDG